LLDTLGFFATEYAPADNGDDPRTTQVCLGHRDRKTQGHLFRAIYIDSDFNRLLAISGASGPSVIRIRREGLRGPEAAALDRAP
jgi:hypothetical protein